MNETRKAITNIVFTKNRPLQLEAYLESLYRYFPAQLIKTYIIYKVELFDREYEQLFGRYPDCVVIRENDFHEDFMSILEQVDTKYILFGIDDVVFFESVDFDVIDRAFAEQGPDVFGFTLRFSPGSLKNDPDVITASGIGGQQVYRLNWKEGQTPHTRYPFELCCTFYASALVKRIIHSSMNGNPLIRKLFLPASALIRALNMVGCKRSTLKNFGYFFSPNTLESWPCRWCRNNQHQLPDYTLFQKLCGSAIQVNMVNTSTENESDNSVRLYHSDRFTHYMACGTFVLAKRVPDTELLARDNEHLCYFDQIEEFCDLAKWYLSHEEDRKRIADSGIVWTHEQFNCKKIAGHIIDLVEKGSYQADWNRASPV